MEKKKVVVVGGGFAGVQLVRKLDSRLFDVLLLDKLNHHQFQPLFYQVATSQLEPSSISFPFRYIFKNKKHVKIRFAEVKEVVTERKEVVTDIGVFNYDYLVIAVGCQTNFFGNEVISSNALTLKSTYDAISIRNHIIELFEGIVAIPYEDRLPNLTLAIVGAGPTGVELAGAFAEIKRDVLPKDYHDIDFSRFRILLIEGSESVLNSMSEKSKTASTRYLERMGVELKTKTFVKDYDGNTLTLSTGETIACKTVIWAAGVTGNKIAGLPEEAKGVSNRIIVDRHSRVRSLEDVYAIGDIAYMETEQYERGHPQVANVAIEQAKILATNLKRRLRNKPLKAYEYSDFGSMATIGRNKAVVDLPFARFTGLFAWVVWMFLHLMLILSVKNKLIIFINWAWAYVTKDTSLGLILKQSKGSKKP